MIVLSAIAVYAVPECEINCSFMLDSAKGMQKNYINTKVTSNYFGNLTCDLNDNTIKVKLNLDCQTLCMLDSRCHYYTYTKGEKTCWLRASHTGVRMHSAYVSGNKAGDQIWDNMVVDGASYKCDPGH